MNILQLVPKLNVGGVEKGTVEVARYLVLNGHKAVVVSGGGSFEKNLAAIGARHYILPIGKKNPFIMIYSYFKLKQIIRKENINIVHARSRIPALIGYFAARKTGRIFITTAHGQYKKHLISKVMGWGKIVIAANETMARYMKDNFDVPLRRISIVPRGVDLEKFSFKLPSQKIGKTLRIGMICRFTPLKGHLDFLKAASYVLRKIPNLEVVMMGDKSSAKEEYIKKIELAIKRLMIGNVVKFIDSSQSVSEVMKSLDILVSANREQEAFGRSIIEAQACGVPVVATKVGGVVETVLNGKTGLLCEAGNPSDMADKILQYAGELELMQRVALAARKYVEDNYSLRKAMEMTMQVYTNVLNAKNILVLKISALGDVILAVPSLRAIRQRYPGALIKVLIDARFRDSLANCPYIDEVIACDFKTRDKGFGFLKLAAKLRSEDFDMSIDLQNSTKSHVLSFLAAIPERYGYDNRKMSFLINRKISLPRKPMSPIAHQACVLGLMGITRVDPCLKLWPGKEDELWAEKFLKDNWLKDRQKIVGFAISASSKWKTKNWGVSAMAEVADMLAKKEGIRVVLLGQDADKDTKELFLKKTKAKPIDAVGKTGMLQLFALIGKCDAVLTGDSAPMHIAAAMETPFTAVFGPTDPVRHVVPGDSHKVLYKKQTCSPCYKGVCQRNKKCMTSIKPTEVFAALMENMKDGKEE
ncbi:MAG: lipopolysaccharide heptosyltransferase II [Candidatus Omnitrophota bacterium]